MTKRHGIPKKERHVFCIVLYRIFCSLRIHRAAERKRPYFSRLKMLEQTVLVECVNEHDNHLMTGRMSNNLLVHFPGDESLIGQLVDVHLDECKGFYYMGRIESN